MTTIDIVKCSTGETIATFHGTSDDAWDCAWGWYGRSHLCPDVDPNAPRRDFRDFEPIERGET